MPKAIVCDNLKAGVTTASRYEPGVNRTYQDLATHYGTTIMPTRPRKPRDKAKVEGAVLIVERWILARLRDRRFFSLASSVLQAFFRLFGWRKAYREGRLGDVCGFFSGHDRAGAA